MKFFIIFNLISLAYCQYCYPYSTQAINLKILKRHNNIRWHHYAKRLSLDNELIAASLQWSKFLVHQVGGFQFSISNDYGENFWLIKGPKFYNNINMDPTEAWYEEMDNYSFKNPTNIEKTANFTQMVWKNTKKIGCGVCTEGRLTIVICRYTPPGNIFDQFDNNVVPYEAIPTETPEEIVLNDDDSLYVKGFFWGIVAFCLMVFGAMRIFIKIRAMDKMANDETQRFD